MGKSLNSWICRIVARESPAGRDTEQTGCTHAQPRPLGPMRVELLLRLRRPIYDVPGIRRVLPVSRRIEVNGSCVASESLTGRPPRLVPIPRKTTAYLTPPRTASVHDFAVLASLGAGFVHFFPRTP